MAAARVAVGFMVAADPESVTWVVSLVEMVSAAAPDPVQTVIRQQDVTLVRQSRDCDRPS